MNVLELSLVLMLLLFAILGSGVWIALALAGVRVRGRPDEGSDAGRASAGYIDVGSFELLGPDGFAYVHLDGRNTLSYEIVRRHVRGFGALAAKAARPFVACECGGLRDFRRRVRIFSGYVRNDWPHRAAGVAQTRL